MKSMLVVIVVVLTTSPFAAVVLWAEERTPTPAEFAVPPSWEYSAPLITPDFRGTEAHGIRKDPAVVYHEGRWHVFVTIKLPERTAIEYFAFEK